MSEMRFLAALAGDQSFEMTAVDALLSGAFDGEITLAELLVHGDLGLGMLSGVDGELIVVDGQAWQALVDGRLVRPDLARTTLFAAVVAFSPGPALRLTGPFGLDELDVRLGAPWEQAGTDAIMVAGHFAEVRVRSVQQPALNLHGVDGTLVGFRFPDRREGGAVPCWYLHFVTADRSRGGHVLGFTLTEGRAWLDPISDLHVELPPAAAGGPASAAA